MINLNSIQNNIFWNRICQINFVSKINTIISAIINTKNLNFFNSNIDNIKLNTNYTGNNNYKIFNDNIFYFYLTTHKDYLKNITSNDNYISGKNIILNYYQNNNFYLNLTLFVYSYVNVLFNFLIHIQINSAMKNRKVNKISSNMNWNKKDNSISKHYDRKQINNIINK